MIYVDVRAKIKQKEIKELVAASHKFIQKVPSKLETQWQSYLLIVPKKDMWASISKDFFNANNLTV